MEFSTVMLLLAAGLLGGAVNAVAGGATLFTFPAMMAAGLPPITANASNALAVAFGNLTGAWSERHKLPPRDQRFAGAVAAAVIGGILGAILLLATTEKTFTQIVPVLIGLATLIFAFAKPIQTWLKSVHAPGADQAGLRTLLIGPACVYGGYFGAGLGVVLMSVFGATSDWDIRTANALKNTLSTIANFAAIIVFVWRDVVSWPETLTMLVAALAGGFIGGALLKVLPAWTVRWFVIAMGCVMSLVYAARYWF